MNAHQKGIRLIFLSFLITVQTVPSVLALPPADDIPEEVLRTEIIIEGRSPIDGKPLSAAEYALLEEQLAQSPYAPTIDPKIRQLIFLLRIRKVIKTVVPFFPI